MKKSSGSRERARFNWRLDEELGGDAVAYGEGAEEGRRGKRRLWLLLPLFILIAALFYWQQARRLRMQEETIKEDVAASYRLWHQAVAAGDLELFLFQLSNQDPLWQNGQQELFLQRRLLQRPDLNLETAAASHAALAGGAAQIVEVTLAPDWQAATVLVDYAYRPAAAEAAAPTVHLRRAHFYRKYGERWLLSPGDERFWGAQQRRQIAGLTLFYPQRDAQIAERIGRDLWQALQNICPSVPDPQSCRRNLQLTVRFERDDLLLASLRDSFTPLFRGGDFVLPTPTLLGLPQDDVAYQYMFEGYTARIVNSVRQNLSPPVPLPQQDLQVLCFPADGRALRLFRYDIQSDLWSAELATDAFRYLMPGPNQHGVILQAFTRGAEATRLRLSWWRDGREQLLYDQEMLEQTRRPVGWSGSGDPHLLLQGFSSAETTARHTWLDLNDCDEAGCAFYDLPGYTVWSPDGTQTLVLIGQSLWRGDRLGQPLVPLGDGLSPFWLDDERYGYIRYDREAGAPSMQLATSRVGDDLPQIVMPVTQLARLLDDANPPLLFINYVAANPADRDQLLMAATTVGYASAKVNIFSLRLSSGQVELLQQFERLPTGYPSLLTPAGYPPFRLSPDGRWLMVTLLASASPTTWTFHLLDLQQKQELQLNAYYPEYPAQFPFYEWTADGRWLAIVEDGYLRLIAPSHNYHHLRTHALGDCLYIAWTS